MKKRVVGDLSDRPRPTKDVPKFAVVVADDHEE